MHGFSHGASLITDISGERFNAAYVRAVSARYSRTTEDADNYIRGGKAGLATSVVIAICTIFATALCVLALNQFALGVTLFIIWQGISLGNAFYAIRYDNQFVRGYV